MNHPRLLCLVSLIALTGGCKAEAVRGNLADLTIIDRDTGAVLTPYRYHGEYWVAGRPGSRYAVEVRNHLGERLLVVMSVDGVNVVSGDTAAWDQGGYVFSPGELYQVTGWRKSDAEVAAFTFTESPNSYAERTGRSANVGVIGVALFRERPPQPIAAQLAPPAEIARIEAPVAAAATPPRASFPPQLNALSAPAVQAPAASTNAMQPPAPPPAAPEPKLGTGHGNREYSFVSNTQFHRMQSTPNEILHIHYDSRANLIAMGIIPRGRPPATYGNPFPGSEPSYVPDPPG
jgi:hypothetical protein